MRQRDLIRMIKKLDREADEALLDAVRLLTASRDKLTEISNILQSKIDADVFKKRREDRYKKVVDDPVMGVSGQVDQVNMMTPTTKGVS